MSFSVQVQHINHYILGSLKVVTDSEFELLWQKTKSYILNIIAYYADREKDQGKVCILGTTFDIANDKILFSWVNGLKNEVP